MNKTIMQQNNRTYFPQLDAIRGISVVVVFFFHSYHPSTPYSIYGKFLNFLWPKLVLSIDVFFILSSFLLTYLGIKEYQQHGSFSFKKYFIRRILRIWPLYYLVMLFCFVILPIAQHFFKFPITLPPPLYYLFFVSNFYEGGHVFFMRLLWTLSVEEQFYLVWGMILTFLQQRLKLVVVIIAIISLAFIITQTLLQKGIYFNTLTYLIDMMAGATAAYLIIYKKEKLLLFINMSNVKEILFYCMLPLLFVAYFLIDDYFVGVKNDMIAEFVRQLFIGFTTVTIIIQMLKTKPAIPLGNIKWLVYVGKISFGIYVLHGFVISFITIPLQQKGWHINTILLAFLLWFVTVFIASISYKYIETPFLKLKNKFY